MRPILALLLLCPYIGFGGDIHPGAPRWTPQKPNNWVVWSPDLDSTGKMADDTSTQLSADDITWPAIGVNGTETLAPISHRTAIKTARASDNEQDVMYTTLKSALKQPEQNKEQVTPLEAMPRFSAKQPEQQEAMRSATPTLHRNEIFRRKSLNLVDPRDADKVTPFPVNALRAGGKTANPNLDNGYIVELGRLCGMHNPFTSYFAR